MGIAKQNQRPPEIKLLLLSLGLGAMERFVKPGSRLGFVPTAGEVYEDPYFVRDDRERLIKLGYHVQDIEISNTEPDTLSEDLSAIDAIFVAGGNSFYLMQQIRSKSFEEPLNKFIVSGKPYIGASAGAVIVGPTLDPVSSLDDPSAAPSLKTTQGLGIVNFVVLPHYGKPKYLPKYEAVISQYQSQFELIPIKDDEALLVTSRNDYEKIESALIFHAP